MSKLYDPKRIWKSGQNTQYEVTRSCLSKGPNRNSNLKWINCYILEDNPLSKIHFSMWLLESGKSDTSLQNDPRGTCGTVHSQSVKLTSTDKLIEVITKNRTSRHLHKYRMFGKKSIVLLKTNPSKNIAVLQFTNMSTRVTCRIHSGWQTIFKTILRLQLWRKLSSQKDSSSMMSRWLKARSRSKISIHCKNWH